MTAQPERRNFQNHLSEQGRRLRGYAIRWGEISPSHKELFIQGSLRPAEAVSLNLEHRQMESIAYHPGGGLELETRMQGLWLEAELPPTPAGQAARKMVASGTARGLSVEFHPRQERERGGIREIIRADLVGVGLVASPSYQGSQAELRRRLGGASGSMSSDAWYSCDCVGSEAPQVSFAEPALQDFAGQIYAAADGGGRDVLAVYKDFRTPLASARKGSLTARYDDGRLDVDIDMTAVADDMAEQVGSAGDVADLLIRPLLDYKDAEFVDTEQGRIVSRALLRAFLVGVSDRREGWEAARLRTCELKNSTEHPRRRPLWTI